MPGALPPRAIYLNEARAIREALLVAGKCDISTALLETLGTLRVVWQCPCRCASLHFVTNEIARSKNSKILADAVGKSVSGQLLGLFVWGTDTEIHTLEAFHLASDEHALLPAVNSLQRFYEKWPFIADADLSNRPIHR